MAVAVQGLGFLESGITDPLNHFSNTLLEFSALLRHTVRIESSPYKGQNDDIILESNNIRPTFDSPSFTIGVFAR